MAKVKAAVIATKIKAKKNGTQPIHSNR